MIRLGPENMFEVFKLAKQFGTKLTLSNCFTYKQNISFSNSISGMNSYQTVDRLIIDGCLK